MIIIVFKHIGAENLLFFVGLCGGMKSIGWVQKRFKGGK